MQEIKNEYEAKGLKIITITGDSIEAIERFWADNNLTLTVLSDKGYRIARKYAVDSFPAGFLINKDGEIVDKEVGWSIDSLEDWKEKLEEYL